MYRNIIVGYDASDEAEDALALAELLRDRQGAITRATEDETGALHRVVHESGADLLVLGSSRRARAGSTHTGPVGRRLLFGSPCTVAVAPKGFRHDPAGPRLVAIAFEAADEALHAVEEGARLAQSFGARVRLLCLVPPVAPWALVAGTDAGYARGDVERHHRETFAHVLEQALAAVPDGVPAEGHLVEGRPDAALAAAAREGADLLVLASPGVRPVPGVRPGATAAAIMRACPCPVLLTPTGTRDTGSPAHAAASG